MADQDLGPDNPSSDYQFMLPYWQMIEAIIGGAETMRAAGGLYLPKFPNEETNAYTHRRKHAPFTNIYGDISRSLASKPFSREAKLKDGAPQQFVDLCEDIDGQGNNFHVFAQGAFEYGLNKAVDWILVDYTHAPLPDNGAVRSQAQEQAAGLRPYWIHVSAERMIAAYSDMVDGKEQFIHARIKEDVTELDGFGETTVCRVRVFNRAKLAGGSYAPATYQVFEKQTSATGTATWVSIEGPSPVTIGVIAIVPFLTGKRLGSSWRVRPPLRDIAFLQVEEYQQESNLKSVMDLTCYPMLVGNGVNSTTPGENGQPAAIRVPVGPGAVLFAPPDNGGQHGSWAFIEPNAESIKTLMAQLDATQKNMRDLGMMPLTQSNLTVITTANIAMKAQSQLQAWTLALKDALEQAFVYTAMWLGMDAKAPEVDIFNDFGLEIGDTSDIDSVLKANSFGLLSDRTTLSELKRRSFLSENLDIDEEEKLLAIQNQGLHPEVAIDPITGAYVQPSSRPKAISAPLPPSDVPTPQSVN